MITKTGLEYSQNSDLSNSTTIEENGEQSSITVPDWPLGTDLYCRAYVIDDEERINSSIEHYIPMDYLYIKNEYAGQNTITMTRNNRNHGILYYYSFDKFNWAQVSFIWDSGYTTGVFTMTFESGEKVYLKSSNASAYPCDLNITCSYNYSIGGDMLGSIIGNESTRKFEGLFMNSTTLIDASEMYWSNSNTLNGWKDIFKGCSNLLKAPYLGNVEYFGGTGTPNGGFESAFEGTSIETIDLHSVNGVGGQNTFKAAFKNSQLRSIQIGQIRALNSDMTGIFYQTFYGCENLEHGLDLGGLDLTLYYNQYSTNVCKEMYKGCINLSEATTPKTVTDYQNNSIITNWLDGAGTNVSGTKTVYCPTGVTVPTDSVSGVPTGWTRVDY